MSGSMLRFAAHPVHAYSTGLPCSTNWFSLFPPENSLFDQTNSLFRGVGNSKLKLHDISGLGGFDPAYSRPNPRNSLFFPCKTGKSGQRRVRSRLRPPPTPRLFSPSKPGPSGSGGSDLAGAPRRSQRGESGRDSVLRPRLFAISLLSGRADLFSSRTSPAAARRCSVRLAAFGNPRGCVL